MVQITQELREYAQQNQLGDAEQAQQVGSNDTQKMCLPIVLVQTSIDLILPA